MKIAGFEILIIEIPLKVSVEHALARRAVARNVLVAAHDTEGRTGWGEACPRSYVTGETVDGARDTLRKLILPDLVGHECDDPDAVAKLALRVLDSLERDQKQPSARWNSPCSTWPDTTSASAPANSWGRSAGRPSAIPE